MSGELFQGEFSRFKTLSNEAKANLADAAREAQNNSKPFNKSRGMEC